MEISEQFGVVSDVLKAPDRLKLPRQMKGDFAKRGFDREGAIPGAAILVVETVAARPSMGEGGVDERVSRPNTSSRGSSPGRPLSCACNLPLVTLSNAARSSSAPKLFASGESTGSFKRPVEISRTVSRWARSTVGGSGIHRPPRSASMWRRTSSILGMPPSIIASSGRRPP